MRIAGVDGCRGGWVAVCAGEDFLNPRVEVIPVFEQLPDAMGGWPDIVAVDMPVGLVNDWGRTPEPEARRLLGRPRSSSVFPSPPRRLVEMYVSSRATGPETFDALNEWSKQVTGQGLQLQTFHLLKKIGEIDAVLQRDEAPPGIFEVHPELAFWAMNGESATRLNKRSAAGREERRVILSRSLPPVLLELPTPRGCAEDDLLDALAAIWSAARLATGNADRVGACEQDPVLRRTIAIWY